MIIVLFSAKKIYSNFKKLSIMIADRRLYRNNIKKYE